MRSFKNKGAVLVLLWASLSYAVISLTDTVNKDYIIPFMAMGAVGFPIMGCLSDVCFGRYKIIRYSLWMLWLSLIAWNGFIVVKKYVELEHKLTKLIVEWLMLLLLIFAPTLAGTHG